MKTQDIKEKIDTGKNLPERKFSTGGIQATVWSNQGVSKEGAVTEFKTVSLQRRYMDKGGAWKSSSSLRISDLPKAALVLNKAYEYLVLKDKDSSYQEEMVV